MTVAYTCAEQSDDNSLVDERRRVHGRLSDADHRPGSGSTNGSGNGAPQRAQAGCPPSTTHPLF